MADKRNIPLLVCYLVVGEDALKRDTVVKRLKTRMATYGDISFNMDEFSGEAPDIDDSSKGDRIVLACNTLPFASEKRLVCVFHTEKLKKADIEAIIAYLKQPCDSTVLCLVADKLARNTRLYKAVSSIGPKAIIDCAPPKKRDIPLHVRDMATSHGITLTSDAASLLVEMVGEDTVRLNNELTRIALLGSTPRSVSREDIAQSVTRTTKTTIWDFLDAFSARNLSATMRYLANPQAESPYNLIARCTSRIRELICVKTMMHRNNPAGIAKALNIPPGQTWRIDKLKRFARSFSNAELRQALARSRDTEEAMKSGANPQDAFQDWIIATLK